MKIRPLALAIATTFGMGNLDAQAALTTDLTKRVTERLADLVREEYVDAGVSKRCADRLLEKLRAESLPVSGPCSRLSVALQRELRAVSKDKHFRVVWSSPTRNGESRLEPWRTSGRMYNHGFHRIDRLPGNVGYLELTGFHQPENAGATALAAMTFIKDCDAILIDLRRNSGGSAEMVKLMASFFLPPRTPLSGIYWRKGDKLNQAWTDTWMPIPRRTKVPLFILTSKRTFSAAEAFAFDLQVLDRAKIVGEVTGGGAHPGRRMQITEGFSVWMPTGKAVNPARDRNWEGTGVRPDFEVVAKDALQIAHVKALRAIWNGTNDAGFRRHLQMEIDRVQTSGNASRKDESVPATKKSASDTARVSVAAFFYRRPSTGLEVLGQIELTFGPLRWKPDDVRSAEVALPASRLRLGEDFYPTFDTSCPIDIDGVTLAPGLYYLAIGRGPGQRLKLVFLAAERIRADRILPSALGAASGGVSAGLTMERAKTVSENLGIDFLPVGKDPRSIDVRLRFGDHVMTSRLSAAIDGDGVQLGTANYVRRSTYARVTVPMENGQKALGHLELTYGSPTWKPAHQDRIMGSVPGARLRLGSNFFASLDTSCAIELGRQRLAPGLYYLALERGEPGSMKLVFLDPRSIREQKRDASHTSAIRGGVALQMDWRIVETVRRELQIQMQPASTSKRAVRLAIRFGPHELTGNLRVAGD